MKITGKCSVLLLSLALSIPYMTFSDARIDKNKRRIAQINRQVTQNRNLIIKNNRQIVVTKRTQASLQSEINDLNFQINKLQKEYNVLEQWYIELLKAIGANEKDIKASISKIQSSNAEIKVNKDENYIFEYDENLDYKDWNLMLETKAILYNLFKQYLATNEQKEYYKQKELIERNRIEKEKKQK